MRGECLNWRKNPTKIASSFDFHENHTKCLYTGMQKQRIRGWDPRSSHLPLNHPKQGPHFLRGSQHQAAPLCKMWARLKSSQPFYFFFSKPITSKNPSQKSILSCQTLLGCFSIHLTALAPVLRLAVMTAGNHCLFFFFFFPPCCYLFC